MAFVQEFADKILMRILLILLVAVIGLLALGLAWISRNKRTDLIVFGGIACLFIGIAGTALFTHASWITWMLGGLAIVGVIAVIWAFVMTVAITNHFNAMAVRDVTLDQPFSVSSAARVARVGRITIRHQKTEVLPDNTYAVALTVVILEPHHSRTEVTLQKGKNTSTSIAKVGNYRIELLDVSSAEANKLSLYKTTLKVSNVE